MRIFKILYIFLYINNIRSGKSESETYIYTATLRHHLYSLAQLSWNGWQVMIVGYQRQWMIYLCCLQKLIRWKHLRRQEVKLSLDSDVPLCILQRKLCHYTAINKSSPMASWDSKVYIGCALQNVFMNTMNLERILFSHFHLIHIKYVRCSQKVKKY